MPIAYHGRSSSVVVSGTPVHRPRYTTHVCLVISPQSLLLCMLDAAASRVLHFKSYVTFSGDRSNQMVHLCQNAVHVRRWILNWRW